MAIDIRIAKGYAWRMVIMGAVCVVLGAWGAYDYAVDIPRRQRLHEQYELLELSSEALQTEQPAGELSPEARTAMEAITADMQQIISREMEQVLEPGQTAFTAEQRSELQQRLAKVMTSGDQADWLMLLRVITQGLHAERHLPLTPQDYPQAYLAYDAAQNNLAAIGQVTAPGKYDRVTQWAFISCLPCAAWFFWAYFAASRRRFTLDDDGTLHTSAGNWKSDEIADIDMSQWMKKSVARVIHKDGRQVKLDDYKFKGLDAIVGSIASRLHPDQWNRDARPADAGEPDPKNAAAEPREPAAGADGR